MLLRPSYRTRERSPKRSSQAFQGGSSQAFQGDGGKITVGLLPDNGGYTLVEMMVAMVLLLIFSAFAMTGMVIMNGSSASSTRLGTSAESSQAAFDTLARYLADSVAPASLSQNQLGLSGTGCSSSPFSSTSPSTSPAFLPPAIAPSSGFSVQFCSYGIDNTSGRPSIYTLDICVNPGSMELSGGPTGNILWTQDRVICPGGSALRSPFCKSAATSSTGYEAWCTPSSLLFCSAEPTSANTASVCSSSPASSPPGDPYLYLTLVVQSGNSTNPGAPGAAPPTTISQVINLANLSGEV